MLRLRIDSNLLTIAQIRELSTDDTFHGKCVQETYIAQCPRLCSHLGEPLADSVSLVGAHAARVIMFQ